MYYSIDTIISFNLFIHLLIYLCIERYQNSDVDAVSARFLPEFEFSSLLLSLLQIEEPQLVRVKFSTQQKISDIEMQLFDIT